MTEQKKETPGEIFFKENRDTLIKYLSKITQGPNSYAQLYIAMKENGEFYCDYTEDKGRPADIYFGPTIEIYTIDGNYYKVAEQYEMHRNECDSCKGEEVDCKEGICSTFEEYRLWYAGEEIDLHDEAIIKSIDSAIKGEILSKEEKWSLVRDCP